MLGERRAKAELLLAEIDGLVVSRLRVDWGEKERATTWRPL
jgi:hypothetical protein